MKRLFIVVTTITLIAGMVGCGDAQYELTIYSTEGGSVTTPGERTGSFTYDEGDVVNLVAESEEGYRFAEWTGDVDDIADIEDATTTITMNGNYTITAHFEAIPPTQYNLTSSSTGGGEVINPGEGTFTYDEGMTIDLTATPEEGYYFVGWTGDVSSMGDTSAASTTITMNDNWSITANFEEIPPGQFGLTISSTTGGSVTVPSEGTHVYEVGTVVSLVADPVSGYYFLSWTGNVSTVANVDAASTTITMNDDYSIMANFYQIPMIYYTLTVAVNGSGSTSPSAGQHTYVAGTLVSITATPASCYHFVSWTGNVATVGNVKAASTTVTMNDNYSITTNFEGEVVTFPDQNVEAAIREAIGKPDGPIYCSDLHELTEFGASSRNIVNLTGLEYCTNLTNLDLEGNQIADISPLANLINLTRLDLKRNQIANISPLANLVNLQALDLSYNEISDISAVGNLMNLTSLGFNHNHISDISAVANLINLTRMSLGDNQISDVSPLANLTSLTWLSSPSNEISNISALSNLASLQDLDLANNQIITISPLANLTSLRWLALSRNQISNISALSSLTNLEELRLGINQISTISALGLLANLTYLYIGDNQISDISPLSSLIILIYLNANGNQISDISPLSSLANLTSLNLAGNQISDFSAIASLTSLTSLDLQHNLICAISALSSLTNLENLHLATNQISDISPLSSLTNLSHLYLLGNLIAGISPLVENTGLGPADYVSLQYNYLDLTAGSQALNDVQTLLGRGVVVHYEPQKKYDLALSSTIGGSVTLPGEGTFAYDPGTVVSLVANPLGGYQFANWTGDVSTVANINAASTTITVYDNCSITANFEVIPPVQYQLAISSTAGGSVTTPGEGTFAYNAGTVVSLVATPLSDCYEFAYWTGDVGTIGDVSAASTTITMGGNYSITGHFIAVVDLANTELNQARTAIIDCMADGGTNLLTEPWGNSTADWSGEEGTVYVVTGNATFDAADYISGPFKASYTVTGYGQIVCGTSNSTGQWGSCIVWDGAYMYWVVA